MALSADQFAKAVITAGLSSAEEIKLLWSSLPAGTRPKDGETFATLLIEREKLTQFQASELLSGSATPLVLGDYVLLAKIGAGGMGQVFKAHHRHMDRLVAIKLLPTVMTKDEAAIQRFQREVRAAAKLTHPNIVQAHDAGVQRGVWYLVMEYVEGSDLSGLVAKQGPLPVERAMDYIQQAAKGLAFAHENGVVHRDIKPANLLLDKKGTIKILDMGLARIDDAAAQAQEGLTQSGMVMGTVDYMAPEQAFDTKSADARADIYSLGCTLYRLLTGQNMYEGETMVQKLMGHQSKPIPSLAAVRKDVPAGLVTIFEKMVAKLADERYQTMAEVEAALAALLSGSAAGSSTPKPVGDSKLTTFFQALTGKGQPPQSAPAGVAVLSGPAVGTSPTTGTAPTVSLANPLQGTDPVSDRSIQIAKQNTPQPAGGKGPPFWRSPLALAVGGIGGLVLLLAAIVFFVQTSEGTIRVEINDPSIEVAIQGTEILLKQADQGKDVKLAPGDKTLIVQRGDFKFETNKLVLKKGDIVTVQVELLAGTVEVKQGDTVLGQAKLPLPPVAKAPFDAAQAKAHQEAWAKHLGTQVETTTSVGAKMILIPPGEFLMGSSDEDVTLALKIAAEAKLDANGVNRIQEERPQHLVRITKPFRLGIHEVTIGQFGKFIEQSGYKTQAEEFGGNSDATKADDPRVTTESKKLSWRTPGQEVGENSPVTQVSWNDAVAFCNWLSEQEKLEPSYVRDGASWELVAQPHGYRLPTEAEWEYACRAGTTTQYSFGDDWKEHDKFGWLGTNAGGRPWGVGLLPANPFGLYDMHGNVWEWCHDWYDGKWYARSPSDDPRGPPGASYRVFRGGGWSDPPVYSRSSYRYNKFGTPAIRYGSRGFRIAIGSMGAQLGTASVTPASTADQAKREREVAAWVISTGGTATFEVYPKRTEIKTAAELAGVQGYLIVVKLVDRTLRLDDVAHFSDLGSPRQLFQFYGQKVTFTRGTLAALLNQGTVTTLGGQDLKLESGALDGLQANNSLDSFRFTNCEIAPDFFTSLGLCKRLTTFRFYNVKDVDDAAMAALAANPPPKLQVLEDLPPTVGPTALPHLAKLPHLGHVRLSSPLIDDTALLQLEGATALYTIYGPPKITRAGRDWLHDNLQQVLIRNHDPGQAPKLHDAAYYAAAADLLKHGFRLRFLGGDDNLQNTPSLEGNTPLPPRDTNDFSVGSAAYPAQVVPAAWQALAKLRDLMALTPVNQTSPPLSPDALKTLQPLQNLMEISFGHNIAPEASVQLLPQFQKLQKVQLVAPSDQAVATLATLPHLSTLWLEKGGKLTDAALEHLLTADVLNELSTHDPITRSAAQQFANRRPDVFVRWNHEFLPPTPAQPAAAPLPAKAPFDTKQAKAHQEAWAKYLGTRVETTTSVGVKMILIPPGEFLMGSSDEDVALALKIAEETKLDANGVQRIQEERPQHLVRITKPFRLGMHEVSIGQFGKFIEQSGYKTQAEEFGGNSDATKADDPRLNPANMKLNWRTPGQEVGENSPVTQVSWNDAVAFCNWLCEQEKLQPSYVRDGNSWTLLEQPRGYRLPTEAEWEYACRAGTTTQFSFGDDWKEHDKFGWSNKNAGGRPRAVGLLPANPFGLYDMHGNVWEWCHDWHDGKWYARSPSDDPRGPPGASSRVFRGGCWNGATVSSRSSCRGISGTPASGNRGFRIALSGDAVQTSVPANSAATVPASTNAAPSAEQDSSASQASP